VARATKRKTTKRPATRVKLRVGAPGTRRPAPAGRRKSRPAGPIYEVHVFLANALRKEAEQIEWTPGVRYSLLIFARQLEGHAADEPLARMAASAAGWTHIKLERAKRLPVTAVPGGDVLRAAFNEALTEGTSVVAYKVPLQHF
jgi:hypothetical protein